MALYQKRLFGPKYVPSTVTDTTNGRYLVPSATTTIIKQIIFCNTSASSITVNASIDTPATVSNRFISELLIGSDETATFNCNIVMSSGEKLFFTCSASSASTVIINGVEET